MRSVYRAVREIMDVVRYLFIVWVPPTRVDWVVRYLSDGKLTDINGMALLLVYGGLFGASMQL